MKSTANSTFSLGRRITSVLLGTDVAAGSIAGGAGEVKPIAHDDAFV